MRSFTRLAGTRPGHAGMSVSVQRARGVHASQAARTDRRRAQEAVGGGDRLSRAVQAVVIVLGRACRSRLVSRRHRLIELAHEPGDVLVNLHRQGAASMAAYGSAIAHATWPSLGAPPCRAEQPDIRVIVTASRTGGPGTITRMIRRYTSPKGGGVFDHPHNTHSV